MNEYSFIIKPKKKLSRVENKSLRLAVVVPRGSFHSACSETEDAGSIHNKASLILAGCLGGKHAQDQPMALSASITFEQLYEDVEGDSADGHDQKEPLRADPE